MKTDKFDPSKPPKFEFNYTWKFKPEIRMEVKPEIADIKLEYPKKKTLEELLKEISELCNEKTK